MVVGAELCWGAVLTFAEDTVEITDVVEAAMVAYFDDGHGAVCQQTGGVA